MRKKRIHVSPLLTALREQKAAKLKGGIYHHIQIDLTYNSNHIEGSKLTHDQTRYIFETNTIGGTDAAVNVDDIIETTNHFRAIDYIIDKTEGKLTESYIKHLHLLLKSGTSDAARTWFNVGAYKMLPNEVGDMDTVMPEDVADAMNSLLTEYNSIKAITFEDILNFHHKFEAIHPFQDGNGRVGRLIMFRECLRNDIVPFIITDDLKMFYYNGLRNWPRIKGYLMDTCLTAQDSFKLLLDKFRIKH
jgi:Fic family protein